MSWNYTDPPKDRQFIADVGFPWAVICVYDESTESYLYPSYNLDLCDGKWNMAGYEMEWTNKEHIRRWCEVPSLEVC